MQLWENAWAEFVPFLAFDVEIRKVICSTNAIESVNIRIRKAVRARGHFPNEQAALKRVYMALMSLDPTGNGRRRWTIRSKAPLNAFQIAFEGRLTPANLCPFQQPGSAVNLKAAANGSGKPRAGSQLRSIRVPWSPGLSPGRLSR
ncbi:transposase [Micromonospora sp. LOL_013]